MLASFNGSNGDSPVAGLTLSGNTLYGTTEAGGAPNWGTVFSVPLSGGSPTVLATFNGYNGENPQAGLTLSADGSALYGTDLVLCEWPGHALQRPRDGRQPYGAGHVHGQHG